MNVGARARSGFRAALNARLEEVSFRTGLITGAVALAALSVIAAAWVYAATLGHGSLAGSDGGRPSAGGAPVTRVTGAPSAPPASQPRQAGPAPTRQPVTADTTSPQPGTGAQSRSWPAGHRLGYGGYGGYGGGNSGGHGGGYGGGSPVGYPPNGGQGPWRGAPGMPGSGGWGHQGPPR